LNFRGYEAQGRISWLPDRELKIEGSLHGSPKENLRAHIEVATKSVPVLGDSRRRLKAEFTAGSPAVVTVAYSWGDELLDSVTCDAIFRKNRAHTVIDLKTNSTLWHGKEARVHMKIYK
jgi:hypothetical protein